MGALRRRLKKCLALASVAIWGSLPAQALSTVPFTPPPALSPSPVIVSGYGFGGKNVTYAQLFNKSDSVVDLAGWQLEYLASAGTEYTLLVRLDGLLKPLNYAVAAETNLLPGADYTYAPSAVGTPAVSLRLSPASQYKPEDVKLPAKPEASYWRRNVSDSTGNYLSTYASFIPAAGDTLYGGGLYTFPNEAGLQISEILPSPRDCSPLDTSLDCLEYVKLYNPTTAPIDMSAFRLRSGYKGQSATSSNTFLLSGLIQAGHYLTVTAAADGRPLTLTNGGGYVWLEDMYGVKLYGATMQDYPDAGSDSRKGQAWAYDTADGAWKWTSRPTPADAPSVFPASVEVETAADTSLTPCQPNQYRSPETNRCRLVPVPEITTLAACSPGQYRSPETNRCRSVEIAASLTPCTAGEERNPETNRCRRMTVAESKLTPCLPSQERNPETNRCRNKAAALASKDTPFPVEPAGQTAASFTGWWVLGGIFVAAASYGIWEWRQELLKAGSRAMRHVPFVK